MRKLIYKQENGNYPITVIKTGKDKYTVTYGLQEIRGLTYERAAQDLGLCIFHSLKCDGKLD